MSLTDHACADEAAHVFAYHADALNFLRQLPDDWCHAIITDPPYGLADHKPERVVEALTAWASGDRERVPTGRGFMGREWDAFVPPPAVWDECLRVLRPGGHLAVFAGSRTVDLMGLSVRLAGFEMRDGLAAWLYGCLTADAEVLTADGWKPGIEVERGEQVAQWHPATGTISLTPVLDTYRAPWGGPMRVLRNADTDQVLTPNHRVYHRPWRRQQVDGVRRGEFASTWEVREAAEVSTWQRTQLPVAGEHDGPGIGGTDYAALLGWVWTEGGFDHSGTGVRIYQSSVNAAKVADIDALLDRLGDHKRYDRERTWRGRTYVETTWFLSGDLARRVRADLPGKRPTYDLLWRMTGTEKRAMRDAALLGDGHVDRRGTWQFYQRHEDDLVWFSTLLALVGQAGKVGMRPDRDNGTVYVRDRATTELQARHLRADREDYTGEVWCVRVPTGAFVARRNGRVFITGNSGFPKSLDVGKAIDGHVTSGRSDSMALREQNATRPGPARQRASSTNGHRGLVGSESVGPSQRRDTPATDAAREWQGWGTALKPAHEPILLARKPLAGTVAANVLAHRAGAINVDACRVGYASEADRAQAAVPQPTFGTKAEGAGTFNYRAGEGRNGERFDPGAGRWPTNVVLAHHPDCGPDEAPVPCAPGCQVAALDEQSGTLTSGANPTRRGSDKFRNTYGEFEGQRECVAHRGVDVGGASRFFPTFRYQAKAPRSERPMVDGRGHPTVKPLGLMRWLVRLLVPAHDGQAGMVIDPFAGSGATLEAARLEGVRAVGVERDAHSVALIAQRLGVGLRSVDPFEELLAAVWAADSTAELDALRGRDGWAAEHDALAQLRTAQLEGVAA